MLRLAAAALFVVWLSLPALPAPRTKDEAPPPNYYPTEVGTRWVYDIDNGKGELALRLVSVEEKDGVKIVTTEQRGTTQWLPFERVEISSRGLSQVEFFGYPIDPWYTLKFPIKAGDKWSFEYARTGPITGWKGTITVIGEEEVTVPAGKFKAVKTEWEIVADDGKALDKPMKSTTWFAPGVGRVKIASGQTLALKSFERGKR